MSRMFGSNMNRIDQKVLPVCKTVLENLGLLANEEFIDLLTDSDGPVFREHYLEFRFKTTRCF